MCIKDAKPLTVPEFKKLMNYYSHSEIQDNDLPARQKKSNATHNIFQKINNKQQDNNFLE